MRASKKVGAISPSATLAISSRAAKMRASGKEVINFAAGEPNLPTPGPVKQAAIKAIDDNLTRYTPVPGVPALRQAIQAKFTRENNLSYSIPEIMVGTGAKQILYNALQTLCEPGDEVILPSPHWVSYPEQVRLADAVPVPVELRLAGTFELDLEALESVLKKGKATAIILNSPHNPTGGVLEPGVLEGIGKLLLRYPVWIISDEIYEHYTYDVQHVSIASLDSELYRRTITVNGVSKTYAMTGWRIGYAGGPEEIITAMTRLQSHSTSCACSISQWASVGALEVPAAEIQSWVTGFARKRELMLEALQEIPGIHIGPAQGAFYLFPDFQRWLPATIGDKAISSSLDLAEYLLESTGVATVPGSAFGREGHLRLSYCTSEDEIKAGIGHIKQALQKLDREQS